MQEWQHDQRKEAEVKQITGAELSGGGAAAQRWHIGQGRRVTPISPRVEPTSGLRELEVSVVGWCQKSERRAEKAEKNILEFSFVIIGKI